MSGFKHLFSSPMFSMLGWNHQPDIYVQSDFARVPIFTTRCLVASMDSCGLDRRYQLQSTTGCCNRTWDLWETLIGVQLAELRDGHPCLMSQKKINCLPIGETNDELGFSPGSICWVHIARFPFLHTSQSVSPDHYTPIQPIHVFPNMVL